MLRFVVGSLLLSSSLAWALDGIERPNAYQELSLAKSASSLKYVGRFDFYDPHGPRFSWSGSQIIARFTGSQLKVTLVEERNSGDPILFSYSIDGGTRQTLITRPGTAAYTLAASLAPGEHNVLLTRETEGVHGYTQFLGFNFGPGGQLLPPFQNSPLRMEVIGDSISAGFGDDSDDPHCEFSTLTQSHSLSYAAIAARALGMDLTNIAFSGKGIHNNWDNTVYDPKKPTMPHDFLYTLTPYLYGPAESDEGKYLYSFPSPADLVVINLGTNDYRFEALPSQDFIASYKSLIALVRQKYPKAKIIAVVGSILEQRLLETLRANTKTVVDELTKAGDANLFYLNITPDNTKWLGCDGHPNRAQQAILADRLISGVRQLWR